MHLSIMRRSQQGSGLVMVIFIIVVVGFVAAVANRNQQRNSQQLVSMVMGTRAEMAARSAAEIAISRYYQENNQQSSCRVAQSNAQLSTPDYTPVTSNIEFQGDGLAQCAAQVSCEYIGVLDNQQTVLQITSIGQCSSGDWPWQRTIQVGVRGEN
ncbi:MSHA biogenesis protein MshP [Vibrio sp. V27_P1S3P104]|uniref:MSHA biogenesis protein MshP n=2 Tax=Vibrionaceae TaxID=641 RepID=UPI000C17046E|nr:MULTISPECIES: MSHA biogenesis protein MshP [Vibrio]NAW70256.1 MSHA biogenesis protein MshP [Vibrio sp. V28_P6S34P95]NAX03784.1 MSHA biogenesis protein MshP [Vibrio sp. V30_P3S12P165]NAX35343.1 MSHA biogenesis protein MshP [Vibrio sp. V29_P1S30P107]NAX36573.1 MSHA biogenesis protein MshP [Vibrio sp. V27_P1S3P104]NAX39149.1 MSHA biogenesis protein MshP [Vibrio sp. V26_P1S5P106]